MAIDTEDQYREYYEARQRMFKDQVERGATWLDKHVPGWPLLVDFETVNMASPKLCIAGQVFADQIPEGMTDETYCGFDVLYVRMGGEWTSRHGFGAQDELVPFWLAAVKERLDQGITI